MNTSVPYILKAVRGGLVNVMGALEQAKCDTKTEWQEMRGTVIPYPGELTRPHFRRAAGRMFSGRRRTLSVPALHDTKLVLSQRLEADGNKCDITCRF